MAWCGDTITLTSDATELDAIECHNLTYSLSANEIDVRSYEDSGAFGEFIACNKQGTVTVNSYLRPDVNINDEITLTAANANSESYALKCRVTGLDASLDSKGVAEFTVNLRLTDSPTFA